MQSFSEASLHFLIVEMDDHQEHFQPQRAAIVFDAYLEFSAVLVKSELDSRSWPFSSLHRAISRG